MVSFSKQICIRVFLLFFLFFIFSFTCPAQQNEIVTKLVKEGIVLHDKGDYEGAIAKFDRALILSPDDYYANYEKSSSCLYAKRYDECIALSKKLIESYKSDPKAKGPFVNCGSAYDDKGDADSAIIMYDEGLKVFPDFYLLHYNKGLTYARQEKWDDAEANFLETMKYKPGHSGSLYYTSLLQEKTNKVAAITGGLAFLAVEPEGKRAKRMYEYIFDLLNSFVKKNDKDGSNTITLSMDKKEMENNFSTVEMGLAIAVAASFEDTVKMKTNVDRLLLSLQIMSETFASGIKEGKGIYWKTYAPFFAEMGQKKLLEVFAHIASITSGDEQNIQWINDNQDKLKSFYEWMNEYQWNK